MSEQRIPIEPNVTVVVLAHKHADLISHTVPEVLITGRGAAGTTVETQPEENSLRLEMFKEGTICVPEDTQITIRMIGGHCKVNELPQGLTGARIGGHLTVQNSGPIQIEHVGGHAKMHHVAGNLYLDQVGGHLKAGPCTGSVSALQVGGHAKLVEVQGGCNLPKVGGHVKLIRISGGQRVAAGGHVHTRIDPLPDLPYELKAGGLLTCDLPSTANATIHMQGPIIGPQFNPTRTMGDGTAQIQLQAGGPITLTEDEFGNKREDLKHGIRETVRAAKAKAKMKAKEVLDENNITSETTADLHEQFAEIAEEAVEVLKEISEEVQEKLQGRAGRGISAPTVFKEISEEVQEKAKEFWEQRVASRVTPADTVTPTGAEHEAAKAAEAEERKMILRMLAENKITVDEANDLLRTLNE